MLIYRFKILSRDHDDFSMEIEIQPGQSFRDFHECIIEAADLVPPDKAFFYPTDKKDTKSTEISLKSYKKQEKKYDPELDEMVVVTSAPRLMKDCKVKNYIEDPHQKLIYEYYGTVHHVFMIELFRIVQSDGLTFYPKCMKKSGELPKKTAPVPMPEPEKPAAPLPAGPPKIVLPPMEGLAKLDDIEENEEELARIEEGLDDLLAAELGEEPDSIEHGEASGDKEMESMFDQEEEAETDDDRLEHIEDYDDIENIEVKYSRYDSDSDDR